MKISRPGRLLLATILWIAVGLMLIWRGYPFLEMIGSTGGKAAAVALGLLVGGAKGVFVLSKSARRTAGYIARRPEQDWIFLCLHPVLWAVIPLMIAMGWALRNYVGADYPAVVAGVYFGIGAAMIVGSRGFRAAS